MILLDSDCSRFPDGAKMAMKDGKGANKQNSVQTVLLRSCK